MSNQDAAAGNAARNQGQLPAGLDHICTDDCPPVGATATKTPAVVETEPDIPTALMVDKLRQELAEWLGRHQRVSDVQYLGQGVFGIALAGVPQGVTITVAAS